jgi:lysozyme family protein
MTSVRETIDKVIGIEGGYSNHPSDRGGPTRWGITQNKAREHGYTGDMRHLPREQAVAIYLKDYWEKPKLDNLATIDQRVAEELFDTAVNMGVAWPGIFLQKALNALNRQGTDFPDIVEDGDIGGLTRNSLRAFIAKRGIRGVDVLLLALNVLQGARYFDITVARRKNEDFLYGWLANRVAL